MISKAFISLLLATLLYEYVASDERIYGGYRIDIKQAPYMVFVASVIEKLPNGQAKTYNCGGTILRKNLILTAAHCNTNETDGEPNRADSYYVNVGTNNKDLTGGTIHFVKNVYVHPKYRGGGDAHFFHDVGLLELVKDIELNDRSKLVSLAYPDDDPKSGTDGTVTGYGENPDHPNDAHLFQVHLNVISTKKCVDELAGGTVKEVHKHQICANAKGKSQCQGDSGGPFHDVSTNRQIGIVSYGTKDCTIGKPSILARVTDNLDFINEIIKKTTRPQSKPAHCRPKPQPRPTSSSNYYWEKVVPRKSRN